MSKRKLILLIITYIGMLFGGMIMLWIEPHLGFKISFSFVLGGCFILGIFETIKNYKENEDEC